MAKRQNSSIRSILQQIHSKASQIVHLKETLSLQITQGNTSIQYRHQIASLINSTLIPYIQAQLQKHNSDNMHCVKEIIDYYQKQSTRYNQIYREEIEELQEEIRRQYKVIGMMKQEVEDLMILIKEQRFEKSDSKSIDQQEEESATSNNRFNQNQELDIIEQQTQRTLLSSDRSLDNHKKVDNIKIEQNSQQQQLSTANKKIYQDFKEGDISPSHSAFTHTQKNQEKENNQIHSHLQSIFFPEDDISYSMNIVSHDSHHPKSLAHSKVQFRDDEYPLTQICGERSGFAQQEQFWENRQNKKFTKTNKKQKIILYDATNRELNCGSEQKNSSSNRQSVNKPKTKQFLEEFRKTFNKCLNSMQVAKKNSMKINNKVSKDVVRNQQNKTQSQVPSKDLNPSTMTFGNIQPHLSNKEQIHQPKQKLVNTCSKPVDTILKDLQNNNRFIIGGKKIELKYQGDRKNGTRHGNGTLFYSNGLCYEGQFKDGMRHGFGILKFNHIEIYNGDWAFDEIDGQGKIRNCAIINKKKSAYCGQNPLGKWISYSGQFKNSRFQGSGTLYLQGGQKFIGKFFGGVACGQGAVYRKNGEIQQGIWENNTIEALVFHE